MKSKLLIIFAIMLLLAGVSFAEDLNLSIEEQVWLDEHPVIYYAPDTMFAPYEYMENSQMKGIVSEYLDRISQMTGSRFEIVETNSWSEVLQAAQDGTVDMIFGTNTKERKEYLLFSEFIIDGPNIILVDSEFSGSLTEDELLAYKVGVIRDYAVHEYLELLYAGMDLKAFDSIEDGLMALTFGEIDAFVVDLGQASYYTRELNLTDIKVVGEVNLMYKLAFMITDDQVHLQSIINKSLMQISAEERKTIYERWVSLTLDQLVDRELFLIVILAVVVLIFILILIGYWNRTLNMRVKDKTKALNQLNEALEVKVFERTEDLKSANEELRMSIDNLRTTQDALVEAKKQAALGSLVAGIAHELNTPLGNCITSISFEEQELKSMNDVNTESIESLVEINGLVMENLKAMANIISRFKVLEISRISNEMEVIDLREIVDPLMVQMKNAVPAHKIIELKTNYVGDLKYYTSKRWIEEILIALIENAILHGFKCKESGHVLLSLVRKDAHVLFTVEDNGCGIESESLSEVFTPFSSELTHSEGLGLGLSIVYNIVVNNIKGTISIQSEQGEFTRVIIQLPVKNS